MNRQKIIMKNTFVHFSALSNIQLSLYEEAIHLAFPPITIASAISQKYWSRLETYYPDFQFFLLSKNGDLIGFMNTIPFHFNEELSELSDDGWDWMLTKGILDFENQTSRNYLGGLQVIIRAKYQGQGYSKQILRYAKEVAKTKGLHQLVIPIRPTKKHEHPGMSMTDYMKLENQYGIADPWIRTHVKNGAIIIKVCENSMNVKGDIPFWEGILKHRISASGNYLAEGALSPVSIDIEKNKGEYREANIWLKYNLI